MPQKATKGNLSYVSSDGENFTFVGDDVDVVSTAEGNQTPNIVTIAGDGTSPTSHPGVDQGALTRPQLEEQGYAFHDEES